MIQQIVEAASGEDAKLRNILLDPKLLAASWNSQEGRFEYDRKLGIPNISKQAYWFCQEQYGCSTRDAILDDGKPAYRKFLGDTSSQTLSKHKEEVPLSTRMLKNLRTLGELKLENSTSGLRERAYKLLLISKMAEIVSGPAAVLLAA
ncbi:MAG TPA: hypothetical protein VNQ78_11775 [Paracoccus sp. (in: a-proteobacteria)]|uniref:hypothetical protein n=1 Tax=Paracoccus sp. TaxID=267 RepID=UPI002C8A45D3|nr:hypothetical protein [Paracoccus sp. (in: a-proteobacteria)]HWL57330.1 hypothetical protein [Paracoccus sp. (in: a-proteobacteria)]